MRLPSRCVEEYIKDTKLDHVPDILSGRSVDDKIHQSYHEIVMSDSDIDKLVSLALPALAVSRYSKSCKSLAYSLLREMAWMACLLSPTLQELFWNCISSTSVVSTLILRLAY